MKHAGLTSVTIQKPQSTTPKEGATMTNKILKNIDLAKPLALDSLVTYQEGRL